MISEAKFSGAVLQLAAAMLSVGCKKSEADSQQSLTICEYSYARNEIFTR